jgi:acyl-CoA synthetase (AMP-forming)/AMP-acid ligase II
MLIVNGINVYPREIEEVLANAGSRRPVVSMPDAVVANNPSL